jgi:hypothetical protein
VAASLAVTVAPELVPIDYAIGLTPFTGADPAVTRQDPKGAGSWSPGNLGAPLASLDRFHQAVGESDWPSTRTTR